MPFEPGHKVGLPAGPESLWLVGLSVPVASLPAGFSGSTGQATICSKEWLVHRVPCCQPGFGLNHVTEEILSALNCQGGLPIVCTVSGLLEVGIPKDRAVVEFGLLPTREQRTKVLPEDTF